MNFSRLPRLLLILVLPTLWHCQSTVYLMPVPEAYKREYFEIVPEYEKLSTVGIGYATNRLIAPAGSDRFYSKDFDQNLRFGTAFIQIGDGNASWEDITDLATSNERSDDVALNLTGVYRMGTLPSSQPLDQLNPGAQRLMDMINDSIGRKPYKHLTVFVHGANNNFYRAMALGAQYTYFAGRRGTMIAYSWPSQESIRKYHKDVANIQATVPAFVRFIKLMAEYSDAERINIIAYSAGAQLVAQSLATLGSEVALDGAQRETLRDSLRLGTVYLAAPDTSSNAFGGQLYRFADLVDNVTFTINDADFVLAISRRFGEKQARLGAPGGQEQSTPYDDWTRELTRSGKLDVIYIDTDLIPDIETDSHDYWYSNSWVSTDTLLLLNQAVPPQKRQLQRREENGWVYWSFPKDYDRRINRLYSSGFREQQDLINEQ